MAVFAFIFERGSYYAADLCKIYVVMYQLVLNVGGDEGVNLSLIK